MTQTSFLLVVKLFYLFRTSTRSLAGRYSDPGATVVIAHEAPDGVALSASIDRNDVGNRETSRVLEIL